MSRPLKALVVLIPIAELGPLRGQLDGSVAMHISPSLQHFQVFAQQRRVQPGLVGQTLDGMRVWDIRRAVGVVQELCPAVPVALEGQGGMGVNVLYASLFESGLDRLILRDLPISHRDGPDYLNVLRVWDLPDALGVTSSQLTIGLYAPRLSGTRGGM